jgi:hypothetical protein
MGNFKRPLRVWEYSSVGKVSAYCMQALGSIPSTKEGIRKKEEEEEDLSDPYSLSPNVLTPMKDIPRKGVRMWLNNSPTLCW